VRAMAKEKLEGRYEVEDSNEEDGDRNKHIHIRDPRYDSTLEIRGIITQEQLHQEEEAIKRVFGDLTIQEWGGGRDYYFRGVPDIA